jgi:hypothetical protein
MTTTGCGGQTIVGCAVCVTATLFVAVAEACALPATLLMMIGAGAGRYTTVLVIQLVTTVVGGEGGVVGRGVVDGKRFFNLSKYDTLPAS